MQNPNLEDILNNPITSDNWAQLDKINALLTDYLINCSQNQKHDEIERVKAKIDEMNAHKKYILTSNMQKNFQDRMKELEQKQKVNQQNLKNEWQSKINVIQRQFAKAYESRQALLKQQQQKIRNAIQSAWSKDYPHDKQYEDLIIAKKDKIIEKNQQQVFKLENLIQQKQRKLSQEHQKAKQKKISDILADAKNRHQQTLKQIKHHNDKALESMNNQKQKAIKSLEQRHTHELQEFRKKSQQSMKVTGI